MNEIIYTGIDIGSKNIKFISISYNNENGKIKILHKNSYPSHGVTDGYISNIELCNNSFSEALKEYRKEIKKDITEAIFTIDSIGLKSKKLKINHQTVNQASITEVDINEIERKISTYAKKNIQGEILDSRLLKYKIGGYNYYSDVLGLEAKKVEAEFVFLYIPENHLASLEKISLLNDISILEINSGNIYSSLVNLQKEDRELGVLNIDIGADKTSMSIWENNSLIYFDSIPFGSDDITKKISLDLKISFSEAEKLKRQNEKNKKIEKIIKTSYIELSEKIKNILIELNINKLLPAGIILYGGGGQDIIAREILQEKLSLPTKKYPKNISDSNTDYHNIYAGVVNFIQQDKKEKIINIDPIKKIFSKIFSKIKL